MYYCCRCHGGKPSHVPARVVRNWDFEARGVSRTSARAISRHFRNACIQLDDVNPKLVQSLPALTKIAWSRRRLKRIYR